MGANLKQKGDIVHPDISEVLYTEDQVRQRVAEIGAALTEEYADVAERGEGIVLLSVLRGAAIFMADLAREIKVPLEMDFMAVSSYGNGVKSSGEVKIVKDLSSNIRGKHVIIAEDILDSGLTLSYLLRNLQSRQPASIEVVTLLRKLTRQQAKINCKYVGFECPDQFIVGYGLDYSERYRNLPYIGVLKPEVYR
mgnify:FL=1